MAGVLSPVPRSAQTWSCTEAPGGLSEHPWTLSEKEASSIQGSETRLRIQTLQLHLLPRLASVLVILSINLASHAWSLPSITRLDETHPLARLPSSSSDLERTTRPLCQGVSGPLWVERGLSQALSPLCTPSLLPESASLQRSTPPRPRGSEQLEAFG